MEASWILFPLCFLARPISGNNCTSSCDFLFLRNGDFKYLWCPYMPFAAAYVYENIRFIDDWYLFGKSMISLTNSLYIVFKIYYLPDGK